ncbi:Kinesin-like protein kif15 [Actinomortierella wolfii]|nr:Kinesin-like protein kif15 [Actinomortierella wolfii]
MGANHVVITGGGGSKSDMFTYDCVGDETTTQEQVFNDVGKRIVEQCVQGYNGTIFAYGQTGSGKTYTMQGPTPRPCVSDRNLFEQRGIIPRCLEYLFELISKEEMLNSSVKYLCKASYIEIYNEAIYDLLDNSNVPRSTREDIKRGVYVDGICEESIDSPDDAFRLFEQGAANRHISATSMNRESSRSHTVLTLTIQSMTFRDGVHHIRESRFNLVDLAGSERQKLAQTEGMRLKEASNINKSLLCLGTVINALVEIASGNSRHVHYRDSKLTFLLKDSLGGNSNTFIIANVSPSPLCYQESLSTLRFAQRAKMIKNKAVVNEDIQGNVNELRAEIQRLKAQLSHARENGDSSSSPSSALVSEEAYRRVRWLLIAAEERLQKEQAAHLETQRKAFLLDDACKAREKQVQSSQLTLKLRDATIAQYRKGLVAQAIDTERNVWEQEIAQLKRQLDFNPEVLKLRAENLALRDLLRKYERLQEKLEEHEEADKKEKEYQMNLSQHLVAVEQENMALRERLAKELDEDNFKFKLADEDNIMQESPPNFRSGSDVGMMGRISSSSTTPDNSRRFSSDTKSLLQRVAQSRKEELRRISGSLKNSSGGSGLGQSTGDALSDLTLETTPLSWKETTTQSSPMGGGAGGENLSESLLADSLMRSEDTVEMTLLKRDMDRLKDENAMLLDEKKELESELSAAGFQLLTLEKSLEEVTRQAEEFARNLQEAQQRTQEQVQQQQQAQKEVSDQIVENLKKDLQEHTRLMEEMQQVSLVMEEERSQLREKLQETEEKVAHQKQELEAHAKKIQEMQQASSVAEAESMTLRVELETANEKTRFLQEEIQTLQQASLRHEEEVKTLRNQLHEAKDQARQVERTMEAAQQQAAQALDELKQQLAAKENSIAELREQQEKLRKEAEQTEQDLTKQLEEHRANSASSDAELQKRLSELQTSLDDQRQQAIELQSSSAQVTERLEQLQASHTSLTQEHEQTVQEKAALESKVEDLTGTNGQLVAQLEEAKLELQRTNLALQQADWDKRSFESIKRELRDKCHELQRKLAEAEHRLEVVRDEHRAAEAETRALQEELEHQLNKTQAELAVKVQENLHLEAYRKRFRELRAQFEGLGQTALSERQRQEASFQERDLQRVMELEKMKEALEQHRVKQSQLEASLALAQEVNEQAQTLHEQVLEETKAGTRKIAEEMEKKLMELEAQRHEAEKQVEQLLEKEHRQTLEIQSVEEECLHLKEKVQEAEQRLQEERSRCEKIERELEEARKTMAATAANAESHSVAAPARPEGETADDSSFRLSIYDSTGQAAVTDDEAMKRQQLKEQLETQRQLLLRMKQEQQALIRQQQIEQREKTMALFEGLATENSKLMEQVRDLGLVNERMMKHQNPKQKLQYHVKIKQENNELRIENQRLMFRAIELEERLGNKENVESLRKQVWAVHGSDTPIFARLKLNETFDNETESVAEDNHIRSQQQQGSDVTRETADAGAAAREPLRSKSTPAAVSAATASRKRPSSVVAHAPPSTRQRKLSSASSSSVMGDRSSSPASSNASSLEAAPGSQEKGSARARAKAAADAALALKQAAGRGGSVASSVASRVTAARAEVKKRIITQSTPILSSDSRRQPQHTERTGSQPEQSLRAVRSNVGGSQLSKAARGSATASVKNSGGIGSASAQRAIIREARRQAAATPVSGGGAVSASGGSINRLMTPTAASRARAATPSAAVSSRAHAAAARASVPPTAPRRTSARLNRSKREASAPAHTDMCAEQEVVSVDAEPGLVEENNDNKSDGDGSEATSAALKARMEFLASPPPPPSPIPPPSTPSSRISASVTIPSIPKEASSSTPVQQPLSGASTVPEPAQTSDEKGGVPTLPDPCDEISVAAESASMVLDTPAEDFVEVQDDATGPVDDDVVLVKTESK